jgi:metal-responsive CopG/Arc/MetJ family transcriptional regulator
MIRRTVAFTNALNQRLKMLAKEENKNFSEVVRDLLAKALDVEKEARLRRMYWNLINYLTHKRSKGIAKSPLVGLDLAIQTEHTICQLFS